MNVKDGKFACDACGKRYAWKPTQAGKKAKCPCGATMVVPHAEADEPAAEADDLYGFAEEPLPAVTGARPMPMAPPVASAASVAQPATAIGYRTARTKENTEKDRFSFDEMTHPPRDLYIPVALLVLGLLGIIGWAASSGAGPVMIGIMSLVTGVATLVKTAVLIGLAFMFAPMLGLSFGDARTAVLKFAAIIVFTDAVGLWFDELIEMAGGMPSGRRSRGRIFWLEMFLIAGLISALCYYLFDMDSEDTGMFAIPFAIISRVMEWILAIVVGAVIAGMLAPAVAPTPAPAAPPTGAPAAGGGAAMPAAPAGPVLQANDRDREIERLIGSGSRMLTEANEYNRSQPQRNRTEPQLVNAFYGAAAKRVYFAGSTIVVQLPDDPVNRTACFAVAEKYATEKSLKTPATKDGGQRYLELELKPEKRR